MAAEKKDIWTSQAYQTSASFVPKLASKVIGWLDVQKDDVILDIGCGDGVIDLQLAEVLSQGSGRLHGVDSSPKMIEAAQKAAAAAGYTNCTFEVYDCNDLVDKPALQQAQFHKVFSNAAMHWILADRSKHEQFFRGVHAALRPGGVFVFEMGGLGNVAELLAGIVSGVSRRVGLAAAQAANPWFFPDEAWVRGILESSSSHAGAGAGAGWAVETSELAWRPTPADQGGIDGWVRLMGRPFLDAVPEGEREACTREIVEVLEYTMQQPGGTYNLNYVRLRVRARKL